MIDIRSPRLTLLGVGLVALVLSAVPLPHVLDLLRPDFLLLIVVWFALMLPRAGGLSAAWTAGLALDAFHGVVLGENALAFVVVAFLVHRFHLRMRMYPLSQQGIVVFLLLLLYQFLLFWIDGVTGHPVNALVRWLPVLTGALLWPVLTGFLGRLLTRH
ncbi:MAG TPA: rod shape-determining protein MreD [Steroidobacteraceae bacterium]|nr:rod shape-determining protein MreD [Steroidobacteraceae bacterium]